VASAGDVSPATAPSAASSDSSSVAAAPAFEVLLTPRKLSATPKCAPYRLDDVTGAVVVTPARVTLRDIAGQHGAAAVRVAGTGEADPTGDWRWSLRLSGDHMLVDDDLRRAAPSSVTALLQSSQMSGTVAIDFSKLDVTPAPRSAAVAPAAPSPASSAPPTTAPRADAPVDVDFALKLAVADSSMNVGVPLAHVTGSADLAGSTRNGKLVEFNGQLDASSLAMAERPLTDLHADLGKIVGTDAMQLKNVRAKLAGGNLAGQFDWTSPDVGSGRYAMNLMLRNADVRELAGDSALNGDPDTKKDDIRGQMSASLALEGVFDQPGSRRGRGDVLVNGRQLYQIPLVLGLLQITNLALPITSPFNEATCRYTVDGGRVTFENIELRAKEMVMQGSGHLDFDTKKVRMTFVTQNETWPKLPVIGDLIQGARNELLQIHIRGTITEPKVSAAAMNTLTTTIDEVFRGANPPPEAAASKVKKTK
jgi:hypothetical protein